jgi:hypothetical protein
MDVVLNVTGERVNYHEYREPVPPTLVLPESISFDMDLSTIGMFANFSNPRAIIPASTGPAWFVSTSGDHPLALQSGPITHGESTSYVQTLFSNRVSFDWWVSSESSYDKL